MRYLFFFAHPDDESIGSAGTIKQLIDQGDEVILVSATDGAAGEVMEPAQARLKELGSVAELRRTELAEVASFLGVTKLHILDFADGEIMNKQVWGELKEAFISLIDQYKPDVVVTFDHSGWYFHLDHVGVSIAATWAYQQAQHHADAFFLSYLKVKGSKWKYVYPEILPITHTVTVTDKEVKLKTFALHTSQDTKILEVKVQEEDPHLETYQLAFASAKGEKMMKNHPVFRKVK